MLIKETKTHRSAAHYAAYSSQPLCFATLQQMMDPDFTVRAFDGTEEGYALFSQVYEDIMTIDFDTD